MSNHAVMFPCTKSYLHEARPLVRSIAKWEPDLDIHITTISDNDKIVTLEDFSDLSKRVKMHVAPSDLDTEFRTVRTYRFYLARQMVEYSSICLLDADMVMFRPIQKFFRMSDSGVIVVCSDSTILNYKPEDFEKEGIPCSGDNVVHPFFSTVPTFVNPHDSVTCKWLDDIWAHPSGNDLGIPNMIAAASGLPESHMIYLNSYQWTNIHHSMLKPETFARVINGSPISYQGQFIYMLHGHWQDEKYCTELLIEPMKRNYGEEAATHAQRVVADLRKIYNEYLDSEE